VISWLCEGGEAEQRARSFGQAFRRGRDEVLARGRMDQRAEARMGRPVIGLSCDLGYTVERPGRPSLPRYEVKRSYADAVLTAGGLPVLLPYDAAPSAAAELLGFCDGLVVTGGTFDVPPEFYGQPPHPRLGPLLPERASFERRLLEEALGRSLPVLGVCGGMQLLAVVAGGELWQDIPAQLPEASPHEQPHDPRTPGHRVHVEAGTRLRAAVDAEEIWVNSTHHQSVRSAGRARVSARSPDGLVEAIELPESFALGVQWHPELLAEPAHRAIFSALVAACRAREA
jgi:putative glutamine amidotransferase